MQRLRPYSKAIAAMVSAIVGVVAVHFSELDSALLEAAILMVLTAAGVYVAPANAPKDPPSGTDLRTPWWVVILLLPLLWLGGCATFGDALGASYLAVDTVAETVRAECGNTEPDGPCAPESAISTEDKQAVKASLLQALDALDDARALHAAGDLMGATNRLEAARSILASVERVLIARGIE